MADRTTPISGLFRGHNNEAGYSLVELIIAMALSLVVLTAVLLTLGAATDSSAHQSNRSRAVLETDVGVGELGRLIRESTTAAYVGGSQAQITLSGGTLASTTLNCTSGTCVATGGSTVAPLTNLSNSDVFTLWCRGTGSTLVTTGCSSFSYVTVKAVVKLSCAGQTPFAGQTPSGCQTNSIEIDDGFNLSS